VQDDVKVVRGSVLIEKISPGADRDSRLHGPLVGEWVKVTG
jgi:hypothetical protein